MEMYDKTEALYYDGYTTGIPGDVEFFVEEAQKAGSTVLELGCGTGRITIPLAEAGIDVIGMDNSPHMLDIFRQKLEKLEPGIKDRIEVMEGDMREFDLRRKFDLVMITFRAFQHIPTDQDKRKTLKCLRRHLTDRGRLIFNMFDPNIRMIGEHSGYLGGGYRKVLEFKHTVSGNRVVLFDTRDYDIKRQVVHNDWYFEEYDDDGRMISKLQTNFSMHYMFRWEVQYLLELCGYEVEALYGDFFRGEFEGGSEQVWIARPVHE